MYHSRCSRLSRWLREDHPPICGCSNRQRNARHPPSLPCLTQVQSISWVGEGQEQGLTLSLYVVLALPGSNAGQSLACGMATAVWLLSSMQGCSQPQSPKRRIGTVPACRSQSPASCLCTPRELARSTPMGQWGSTAAFRCKNARWLSERHSFGGHAHCTAAALHPWRPAAVASLPTACPWLSRDFDACDPMSTVVWDGISSRAYVKGCMLDAIYR